MELSPLFSAPFKCILNKLVMCPNPTLLDLAFVYVLALVPETGTTPATSRQRSWPLPLLKLSASKIVSIKASPDSHQPDAMPVQCISCIQLNVHSSALWFCYAVYFFRALTMPQFLPWPLTMLHDFDETPNHATNFCSDPQLQATLSYIPSQISANKGQSNSHIRYFHLSADKEPRPNPGG